MEADAQTQSMPQSFEEMTLERKTARMGRLMHRYHMAQAHKQGSMVDPTRGQGRILALLAVKPQTTQRELSYLLDMRQQSLSELLGKLEEKGYITRSKSEQDGRVTVVQLTEEGAAAAPSPNDMDTKDDSLDCLDDEERAQLESLVDKVIGSLEEKLVALGVDPYAPPRGHHRGHGHHGPHHEHHGWEGGDAPLRQA